MKQGKEENNKTRNYIFQKNKVTKVTVYIIAGIIALCFIGFIIFTIDLF